MYWITTLLLSLVLSSPACERTEFRNTCRSAILVTEDQITAVREVVTDIVSLKLPVSLKDVPTEGDFSRSWQFSDDQMIVRMESGLYVPSFDELKNYRDYCAESTTIDGLTAKVVSVDFSKSSGKNSLPYMVGAYFPKSDQISLPINVTVRFQSKNDTKKAFNIINSIKVSR